MSFSDNQSPEPSVPFVYPNDEVKENVNDDSRIAAIFDFLCYYVLTSRSPQTTLTALLYAAGWPVGEIYSCPNTARGISKATGIVHVQFHKELVEISSSLGLVPRINNGNRK